MALIALSAPRAQPLPFQSLGSLKPRPRSLTTPPALHLVSWLFGARHTLRGRPLQLQAAFSVIASAARLNCEKGKIGPLQPAACPCRGAHRGASAAARSVVCSRGGRCRRVRGGPWPWAGAAVPPRCHLWEVQAGVNLLRSPLLFLPLVLSSMQERARVRTRRPLGRRALLADAPSW